MNFGAFLFVRQLCNRMRALPHVGRGLEQGSSYWLAVEINQTTTWLDWKMISGPGMGQDRGMLHSTISILHRDMVMTTIMIMTIIIVIDWRFPNQAPLPLKVGNVVEVLHDGGTGWVFGHLVGAPENKGFFPLNYTAPMEEYLREMERLRQTNPAAVTELSQPSRLEESTMYESLTSWLSISVRGM
eukprot:s3867_g3.t1